MHVKVGEQMKETTALNQISRIVDKLNYKSIYIEINTENNKYTSERDNNRKIGFRREEKC